MFLQNYPLCELICIISSHQRARIFPHPFSGILQHHSNKTISHSTRDQIIENRETERETIQLDNNSTLCLFSLSSLNSNVIFLSPQQFTCKCKYQILKRSINWHNYFYSDFSPGRGKGGGGEGQLDFPVYIHPPLFHWLFKWRRRVTQKSVIHLIVYIAIFW